ncbi:MAG: hypothetical protein K8R36_12925 [Planctomycetales bacterium]|nr:hypothetical protein [Planctomycetales bacterium]
MILNDNELEAAQKRISRFQAQVSHLRKVEPDPENFRLESSAYLSEIDKLQLEVREYLFSHPSQMAGTDS